MGRGPMWGIHSLSLSTNFTLFLIQIVIIKVNFKVVREYIPLFIIGFQ